MSDNNAQWQKFNIETKYAIIIKKLIKTTTQP